MNTAQAADAVDVQPLHHFLAITTSAQPAVLPRLFGTTQRKTAPNLKKLKCFIQTHRRKENNYET